MKKAKTKPAAPIPEAQEQYDPFRIIAITFDINHLSSYRHFITDILLYSSLSRAYRKELAGELILTLDEIAAFLKACFDISKQKHQSSLIISEEDVRKRKLVTNKKGGLGYWDDFPKVLSMEEFKNPYLAFRLIFEYTTHEKLHDSFKQMMRYACSNYVSYPNEGNTLLLYQQLMKLFEAAHLINVREICQTEDFLKHPY